MLPLIFIIASMAIVATMFVEAFSRDSFVSMAQHSYLKPYLNHLKHPCFTANLYFSGINDVIIAVVIVKFQYPIKYLHFEIIDSAAIGFFIVGVGEVSSQRAQI